MQKHIILTQTTTIFGTGEVNLQLPSTITLKSSDASRSIQIATDNGVEFFSPPVDTTTATMLVVTIAAPITNIKVIGAIGDTLVVGS